MQKVSSASEASARGVYWLTSNIMPVLTCALGCKKEWRINNEDD
jgi:hypothetical protein